MTLFKDFKFSKSAKTPAPKSIKPHSKKVASGSYSSLPILVSRDDIYDAEKTVLLLKAGTEISSADLPRLMRHGIKPGQFYLKDPTVLPVDNSAVETGMSGMAGVYDSHDLHDATVDPDLLAWTQANECDDTPEESSSLSQYGVIHPVQRSIREEKSVLVLDGDSRNIQKTVRCLEACGFYIGKLHPVRKVDHLAWSISKYRPQILIIDFESNIDATNGSALAGDIFALLDAIEVHCPQLEQVVLSIPANLFGISEHRQNRFLNRVDELQLDVVVKPVNRFVLNRLFDSAQRA